MNENIVKITNMTKRYGKQNALDDISFDVKKGSIVGLIGPNGAGKTTIMKIMGGLVFQTKGGLEMFGETDERGLNHARTRMSFNVLMAQNVIHTRGALASEFFKCRIVVAFQ